MNAFVKALSLAVLPLVLLGNSDLPPPEYQGIAKPSVLVIVADTNHDTPCGVAPPGFRTMGCHIRDGGVSIIFTANPCLYPEAALDKTSYAHLMCHELGHANGWKHED